MTTATGFIDDLDRWIVDGATALDMKVGTAVVMVENRDGLVITEPWGAQVKTELGWAGPEPLRDILDPLAVYKVVHPDPSPLATDHPPASSYREYEASLHAVDR